MLHQQFHLVDQSPWPLLTSVNSLTILLSILVFTKTSLIHPLILSVSSLLLTLYQWWRDVVRESTFQGYHTSQVLKGLKIGMILFIISEMMFFLSFFWAFFHSSLSPDIHIGAIWPPMMIIPFNPMLIPLLNTTILLTSGVFITWAHHSILNSSFTKTKSALLMTVLLGLYFSILQSWEYYQAPFSVSDSIYGSIFFMTTGFHGLHVLLGTTFLIVTLIRLIFFQFSSNHHFGFEAAAWYWHFVDVIWLFLYLMLYWWGK